MRKISYIISILVLITQVSYAEEDNEMLWEAYLNSFHAGYLSSYHEEYARGYSQGSEEGFNLGFFDGKNGEDNENMYSGFTPDGPPQEASIECFEYYSSKIYSFETAYKYGCLEQQNNGSGFSDGYQVGYAHMYDIAYQEGQKYYNTGEKRERINRIIVACLLGSLAIMIYRNHKKG